MRKHQIVAICWSALNVGLASRIPTRGPFPWFPVALLALLPLFLIFFAEAIAANLHRGPIQWLARDRNEPQSPLVVMFVAWIVLTLETLALLVKLA